MENMRQEQMNRLAISQLENVVRGLGWRIIATDTRGEDMVVSLSKTKAQAPAPSVSPASQAPRA